MTNHHRRTPCIGICSTTYGDLVCRGCKRFAHEIVQWNGYAANQQQAIWTRLWELRTSTVARHLSLIDAHKLEKARKAYAIEPANWQMVVWQLLQQTSLPDTLTQLGLAGKAAAESPKKVALRLDKDLYLSSLAYYERSFRTLAQ